MSGDPNPIRQVTGLSTTDNVSKDEFIAWALARVGQIIADADELRSLDLAGQLVVTLKSNGRTYVLNTLDTTTEDDGEAYIRDANEILFERLLIEGVDGADGADGEDGADGADGAPGAAATISIGTVTGLAAGATPTVANSGSSSAAVFDFGIPAGPKGEGLDYDVIVADITERDTHGSDPVGTKVAVSDIGDGTSAIYELESTGPAVWSDPIHTSSSTASSSGSDIDLTLALSQMQTSALVGNALLWGTSGNRFADSFGALTYVDTGAATNLNSATSGQLAPKTAATSLFHFDGSNGQTTFTEETGRTVSRAGDAQISTAQFKFGGSSLLVDGTGDYVSVPDSSDFDVGSGDFWFGVWVRLTAQKNYGQIVGQWGTGGNNAWNLRQDAASHFQFVWTTNGTTEINITDAATFSLNTWYYIEVSRSGSNIRVFKDGTQIGSTDTSNPTIFNSSAALSLGGNSGAGDFYQGYIDDFVFIKGTAGHTTTYTAPTNAYGQVNNLTVTSTALTAASVPTTAKAAARVKEIDSITLNTDLIFYVSRDGGTTYTAFVMTKKFTDLSGIAIYESADLNISAQPSGTNMKWKAVSANNKSFEIRDVYLSWN